MHRLPEHIKKNREMLMAVTGGVLMFFMPLSIALTNLMLIPIGLIVLAAFSPKEWFSQTSFPILFYIAAVSIMVVLALFKGSFFADIQIYTRYVAVVFLFLLFSKIKKTNIPENFFLAGLIIAVCIANVKIIQHQIENPGFLFDTGVVIDKMLWESRPLAAFMLVLGIFICLRRIFEKPKKAWIFYLITIAFFVFCFYISARLSIVLAAATIFYFLLFRTQIKKRFKVLASLAFLLGFTVMVLFNDSLMSRMPFGDEREMEQMIAKAKDREPRYVIWSCASKLLKTDSNALIGIAGYDKYRQDLVSCYGEIIVNREEKRDWYMYAAYNSHNQFLDFWLNGGILPVIFLLLVFVAAWATRYTCTDMKWLYFLFFTFFMVENVLYRQVGYYLFGIFVALYTTHYTNKSRLRQALDIHEKSVDT